MKKLLLVIFLFPQIFVNVQAWEQSYSISFEYADLQFDKTENYDLVSMKNLDVTYQVGAPQLPVKIISLTIPQDAEIQRIEIISLEKRIIPGTYIVLPTPQPTVLSSPQGKNLHLIATKVDEKIYAANSYYPETIIQFSNSSLWGNSKIANFLAHPVQYLPTEGKLLFYSMIEFKIHFTQSSSMQKTEQTRSKMQQTTFNQAVHQFTQSQNSAETSGLTFYPENEYQYLLITSKAYLSYFQPLISWKIKKGVPARFMLLDDIFANYEGRDEAEKIRNFIKYARENWGTIWVLLGGDTDVVPYREAFAMDCQFGADPDENNIPCDLYFSDLDGDWETNGNNIFGEVADNVDLYPDVFVGRASVNSVSEVQAVVNKIITYEKSPQLGFQRRMLFAAELLWLLPYTNTGLGKDMIESECLPSGFYSITKLYEDSGNESDYSVIHALNNGQLFFNHDGHAWNNVMGMGNGNLDISEVNELKNGPDYPVCFSIGCYPAAIDRDCIAEAFVANPNGGCIAFIGNSRYGWGSPGNPGLGYSDRFDHKFFECLFKDKIYNIGLALALAKAFYIPYSQNENVYRWCMYEINLLGDPEMPMWTDVPQNLTVTFPGNLPVGTSTIKITVMAGEEPVANARVCLQQDLDVYTYGFTAANGQIDFTVTLNNVATDLNVTATAQNFIPYEGKINVISENAYVAVSEYTVDDSLFNGDGYINPGETIHLNMNFTNYGNQLAESVSAVLLSNDSTITVVEDSIFIGNISASDSVCFENSYTLKIDPSCKNGTTIPLAFTISDSLLNRWECFLPITITSPILSFENTEIFDEQGNGNGIPEPGETCAMVLRITNQGLAPAHVVTSTALISQNNLITTSHNEGQFGDILLPQQSATDTFTIQIDNAISVPSFGTFNTNLKTGDDQAFPISFKLAIGQLGFYDNVENGSGDWTIVNTANNMWHISSIRSHSADFSWYCGNEQDTTYFDNNSSILYSPEFYIGANATLSFWIWFDVAIYSKTGYEGDGVKVEIFDGIEWQKLDFIGTGGALSPILMGCDWCEFKYDLSSLQAGLNSQLKFKFISDPYWNDYPETHEGVYIDDIKVTYDLSSATTVQQQDLAAQAERYWLNQNYPNPFNQSTLIEYEISGSNLQPVTLSIFNILGQKIRTLVDCKQTGGAYSVYWDGRNSDGLTVASGIYYYTLEVNDIKTNKKLVLLR